MNDGRTRPRSVQEVRVAATSDLAEAARIHAAGDAAMVRRMHPLAGLTGFNEAARARAALAGLQALHEEDPRQVWIARVEGQVVGVASAAFRGRHVHVQSLFVVPRGQERGIGADLLNALHAAARAAGCTIVTLQASDDPRALTRYLQIGLRPQPPNMVWSATNPLFPTSGLDNPFELLPLSREDESTLNTVADIDKAVRGAARLGDLRRWLEQGERGALLIDRASGRPAGYFLVSCAGGRGHVGPVAAMDQHVFGPIFDQALAAAASWHAPEVIWRVATPGENHAAVAPLLAARFRPAFSVPFYATAPVGRFDRYAFHDLDLL